MSMRADYTDRFHRDRCNQTGGDLDRFLKNVHFNQTPHSDFCIFLLRFNRLQGHNHEHWVREQFFYIVHKEKERQSKF